VNGQDETLNNWVVDGVDDNERVIGTIGVKPSIEGIQEITVETNSYAPEAGRTAGGVINIVTKPGTNQFHGSVYEYFRNDIHSLNGSTPQALFSTANGTAQAYAGLIPATNGPVPINPIALKYLQLL